MYTTTPSLCQHVLLFSCHALTPFSFFFFFFNDTATTEIYTLSLHDALPIFARALVLVDVVPRLNEVGASKIADFMEDRKSTRLNSSHANISYAVFCLKKKKNSV